MLEFTCQTGSREEAKAFFNHWRAKALEYDPDYDHMELIEEDFWGHANQFLVAVSDGAIVGVSASLVCGGKPSHFLAVVVDPHSQRNGVGEKLTNDTLALLVENGHVPIHVDIVNELVMHPILERSPYAEHLIARGIGRIVPRPPNTNTGGT